MLVDAGTTSHDMREIEYGCKNQVPSIASHYILNVVVESAPYSWPSYTCPTNKLAQSTKHLQTRKILHWRLDYNCYITIRAMTSEFQLISLQYLRLSTWYPTPSDRVSGGLRLNLYSLIINRN